jgi:hypothetical protein
MVVSVTLSRGAIRFLAFLDPPKAGAREALKALANLGVTVKVVTGDNERVTRRVCNELELRIAGTLTGPELATLTDEALSARRTPSVSTAGCIDRKRGPTEITRLAAPLLVGAASSKAGARRVYGHYGR